MKTQENNNSKTADIIKPITIPSGALKKYTKIIENIESIKIKKALNLNSLSKFKYFSYFMIAGLIKPFKKGIIDNRSRTLFTSTELKNTSENGTEMKINEDTIKPLRIEIVKA